MTPREEAAIVSLLSLGLGWTLRKEAFYTCSIMVEDNSESVVITCRSLTLSEVIENAVMKASMIKVNG